MALILICYLLSWCGQSTGRPTTRQLVFRSTTARGYVHPPYSFTRRIGVGMLPHPPVGVVLQLVGMVAGHRDWLLKQDPAHISSEDKTEQQM